MTDAADDALSARREGARAWLFEQALPLWAEHGPNPRGGFHDRLTSELRPAEGRMRLRVQARQTYVFAEAGALGWSGPWRARVAHGLEFLLGPARRDDGLFAHTFDAGGEVLEAGPDLYDQAFALFGFAAAYRALGDGCAREAARDLLRALEPWAEPGGGYRELSGPLLKANPNMHLLEAALAWSALDADAGWSQMADGLVELCARRLTDPATSALREVFVENWRPAPPPEGEVTEPGHQFEWAWLIERSGRGAMPLALRLSERAERCGVDAARGVAVNTVDVGGAVLDARARLWPQTERLKAALALRPHDRAIWTPRAVQAHDALFAYMAPARPGLWFDVMETTGEVVPEPSPASSLYHIVAALSELIRADV